jgi:hypothetical protein
MKYGTNVIFNLPEGDEDRKCGDDSGIWESCGFVDDFIGYDGAYGVVIGEEDDDGDVLVRFDDGHSWYVPACTLEINE